MKPENLHLNRYHLNVGENIYQHWMLSHLSEKNFSYRWLLIFFFFSLCVLKREIGSTLKFCLAQRRGGGWLLDWPNPWFRAQIFSRRAAGACRRQSSLLPGSGPRGASPAWSWRHGTHDHRVPTPTTMPSSLGMSPGPHSQQENQTFYGFVRHLCGFGTQSRK